MAGCITSIGDLDVDGKKHDFFNSLFILKMMALKALACQEQRQ
jgi:hypothetical protein